MTLRFMKAKNDRVVDPGWAGDVYVWDIDKTYLDTRFSSLRGLLSIPFELAVDKNNIAGTVPLLRALRTGPDPKRPLFSPLYFVSGSPPHLRDVVEKKMILDGVQFDGITFKDQLGLLLAGRPRAITEQVGYKLNALLNLRTQLPTRGVRFSLFGDDVEKDMESFLLFGAVCAGLRGSQLREEMRRRGAHWPEIEAAVEAAAPMVVEPDPVERVYIHSVKGRLLAPALGGAAGAASQLDRRVVVCRSFLQAALLLRQLGKIDRDAPRRVRDDLMKKGFVDDEIRGLVEDARVRLQVDDVAM